ncbi:MAG: HAD hydrolase-like protein [Solirubrobacteraceae bacterium]
MTPTTVLFDLDGVLIDSRAAFTASVNHALGDYGLPAREPNELRRFIGPPLRGTFAELGVARDDIDARVDAYRDHYAIHAAAVTTVFAGIPDMLEAIGARHRLVIATSKAASLAEAIVLELGLAQYFDALHGPANETSAEPKSETVARALPAIALIGDTRYDVEAARANGLRPIAVSWGIGAEDDLRAAGAEAIVHAPDELEVLL